MGSLVFALLRKNHIVLAADRRHTRGDAGANYSNDRGLKTMIILAGRGVLGFAGADIGEQIVLSARDEGKLEGPSLRSVSEEFAKFASTKYKLLLRGVHKKNHPRVDFLLAAFDSADEGFMAASYSICSPQFHATRVESRYRPFEVIGRGTHGALYALHRFAEHTETIDSDLALSAFVLSEIAKCDTTIGGIPDLYVIHREQKATRLSDKKARQLAKWAEAAGKEFGKIVLKGPA